MTTILVTGASGELGSALTRHELFKDALTPTHQEMDITKPDSIKQFLSSNTFDVVVHCAALARMKECEEHPSKAALVNTMGTFNLVSALLETNPTARFLQISTDGVYQGTTGNYKETDHTEPYNVYCWSKLGAEKAVELLENHCIIRTSFFDEKNIVFPDAATDAFSSKLPLSEAVEAIATLATHKFSGIVNMGREKRSDFEHYAEFKPDIKETSFQAIQDSVDFPMAQDASMDITLWKKLREENRYET